MSRFQNHACWKPDRLPSVVQTQAETFSESVFLATHAPFQHLDVERPKNLAGTNESTLLNSILDTPRHVFAAIVGAPGSGKSRLIRWMAIQLERRRRAGAIPDGEVILVERADGSLRGTIARIAERLGEKYADLVRNLRNASELNTDGLKEHLVVTLATLANPANVTASFPVSPEIVTLKPWVLMREEAVLRRLCAEGGTIDKISRKILHGEGPEGVSLPEFDEKAFAIPPSEAMKGTEANLSLRALEKGGPLLRQRLATYLNARLRTAAERVLQLRPNELKDIFTDLRKRLHERGKSLYLLVADIAVFAGLDVQLIESLILDPKEDGSDGLCKLVSVVGVTDGPYSKQIRDERRNVHDRVTHLVWLTPDPQGSSVAGTNSSTELSTREEVGAFAARYLNVLRLEKKDLDAWARRSPQTPVPNQCTECPHMIPCHASFGASNGVGLYPFNAAALDSMFRSIRAMGQENRRTPRGLLNEVLEPVMRNAKDQIEAGAFPPSFRGMGFEVPPLRDLTTESFLEARAQGEDGKRVEILLRVWGDRTHEISSGVGGASLLGGVSRGVFDAFAAPFLGETTTPAAAVSPAQSESSRAPGPAATPLEIGPRAGARTGVHERSGASVSAAPAAPKLRPKELETRLAGLSRWKDGKVLEASHLPIFRDLLFTALEENICWEAEGVPKSARESRFESAPKALKLERQTGRETAGMLEVPAKDATFRAVNALLHWKYEGEGSWSYRGAAAHLIDVQLFVDGMRGRVLAHVRSGGLTVDGKPWDPFVTALECLAVGTLLFGYEAASPEQLFPRLFGRAPASPDLPGRGKEWENLHKNFTRTGTWDEVRAEVIETLNRPQGEGTKVLLDAGRALHFLRRVLAGWKLSPVPSAIEIGDTQGRARWKTIASLRNQIELDLDRVLSAEIEAARTRAGNISGALEGESASLWLEAVTAVIHEARDANCEPGSPQSWEEARGKARPVFAAGKLDELLAKVASWKEPLAARSAARYEAARDEDLLLLASVATFVASTRERVASIASILQLKRGAGSPSARSLEDERAELKKRCEGELEGLRSVLAASRDGGRS